MSCSTDTAGLPGVRVEMSFPWASGEFTLPGGGEVRIAADPPTIPDVFMSIMRGPPGPPGNARRSAFFAYAARRS